MRHLLAVVTMNKAILSNERAIYNMLLQAAHEAGATVLGAIKHELTPFGLTAVVILAESHISLHTYPEQGKAYLDAFTCGALNPQQILKAFCGLTGATIVDSQTIKRL